MNSDLLLMIMLVTKIIAMPFNFYCYYTITTWSSDIHLLYKGQLSAYVHSVALQLSTGKDVLLSRLYCLFQFYC